MMVDLRINSSSLEDNQETGKLAWGGEGDTCTFCNTDAVAGYILHFQQYLPEKQHRVKGLSNSIFHFSLSY